MACVTVTRPWPANLGATWSPMKGPAMSISEEMIQRGAQAWFCRVKRLNPQSSYSEADLAEIWANLPQWSREYFLDGTKLILEAALGHLDR